MRCLILVAVCVFAVSALPEMGKIDVSLNGDWENFKTAFGKTYDSQFEYARRMIWESNVRKIRSHNLDYDLGKFTYTLGMNEYGDLTDEEFKSMFLGFRMKSLNTTKVETFMAPLNIGDIPTTVDWRTKGYVTPVKSQKDCGACWAFSTTGSLEGQHVRKTGRLVSLSEQQLVDCSSAFDTHGCNGGNMPGAFRYIKENGGIDSEESYGYEGKEGQCKFSRRNTAATCTGYVALSQGDEDALKTATATIGPISVGIDVHQPSFKLYEQGIYDEPKCTTTHLNHAVLVVGYGTDNGVDYWLVKNSWGTNFGMKGYIKMSRNKNNQCGIATAACYPTV